MTYRARGAAMLLTAALLAISAPTVAQDDAVASEDTAEALLQLSADSETPAAGDYRDDSLDVELEFTLGEGWKYGWALPFYGVWLEPELPEDELGALAITTVDGWLYERPCRTEGDSTFEDDHVDFELTPESMIEFWAENPYLDNGGVGVVPVTIAGTDGYRLDVVVRPGRRCSEHVPLWGKFLDEEETESGPFFLMEDERGRIYTLEADGMNMVIVLTGVGAEASRKTLEVGMPLIESLSLPSMEQPEE